MLHDICSFPRVAQATSYVRLAFARGRVGIHELALADVEAGQIHTWIAHETHVQIQGCQESPTSATTRAKGENTAHEEKQCPNKTICADYH